jgi:hypothetical protein
MSFTGIVENGAIKLPLGLDLPEGLQVEITLPASAAKEAKGEGDAPSLYEQFKPFIGVMDDLPSDLAINHDHYLYGSPKQQP